MPFRSKKQRRYLWANEPELAEKWTKKYGSKVGGTAKSRRAKLLKKKKR